MQFIISFCLLDLMEFPRNPVTMRCQFVRRQIPAEAEIEKNANEAYDDSESEQTPSFMNMDEKQYGFVTPTRDDQEMPEFPNFSDLSESSSAKQFETIEDETSTLKTSESVGSARNNIKPFFNDNNLDQSEDEDEIDDEICKTIDDSESISLLVNMDEKQYEFVMLTRDDQEMTEYPNFSDLSNSISSQQDEMEAIVVDEASTLKSDGIDEPMRIHKKPIICDKNLEESEDEDEMEDEINSDYPENHIDGLLSTCGLSDSSVV